eukprot:2950256-Prymnesium_polylepis.1
MVGAVNGGSHLALPIAQRGHARRYVRGHACARVAGCDGVRRAPPHFAICTLRGTLEVGYRT